MNKFKFMFFVFILSCSLSNCCKDKHECNGIAFQIKPFVEKYGEFSCGSNDYEYTYIFNSSKQIDSLYPICKLRNVAFPIDETNMKYFIIGRTAYHYRDTFTTSISKDTCLKTITYGVNMIQQNTALNTYPGTISIFTALENIPADYNVSVNYKYVPLP